MSSGLPPEVVAAVAAVVAAVDALPSIDHQWATSKQTGQPPRWEPDANLIPSVLFNPSAPKGVLEMGGGDRAWTIACLELAGEKAERTEERMDCSLRQVRMMRADDATHIVRLLVATVQSWDQDVRAEQARHAATRAELADVQRERDRLRYQMDCMVDKLSVDGKIGALPCGHPNMKWNTRKWVDKSRNVATERIACLTCDSKRASDYRRNKAAGKPGKSHRGVTKKHPASVGSAP